MKANDENKVIIIEFSLNVGATISSVRKGNASERTIEGDRPYIKAVYIKWI